MLDTIFIGLEDTDYPGFAEYFMNYINQVQDINIGCEVKAVPTSDILGINGLISIDNLINKLQNTL